MSWHEWMQVEQNQFVVVLGFLSAMVSYLIGHKIGYREGYEDGVRTMAKVIFLNELDLDENRSTVKNHEC